MGIRTMALLAAMLCVAMVPYATETTTVTFTRAEIAQMALLWETDTLAISPLANAQYPVYTTSWQYIFPHTSISTDGDVHSDMAVDNAGTGSSGNNTGASPIVTELINAVPEQLTHLDSLPGARAIFRGIFRFYTEHAFERHFELHPITGLDTWNGSAFVLDTDYHANVTADPNATTHSSTTLTGVINGSQTMTATVQSNNTKVNFDFPSPSVNYVQYAGVALSTVVSDATSSYFLLRPNLFPSATLKCRLVANTDAAAGAAGLSVNQTVTVNALTRTDMGYVASQIANLTAGQSATFPRQVELIVLGLPGLASPLQVIDAVSRKTHGAAGTFNIGLPLTGTAGIECRTGGASNAYSIVVTFNNDIASGNASVTAGAASISGSPVIFGKTVTVNLTGVANAQTVTVSLNGVTDTSSQVLANTVVNASFLLGDTTGNGTVNASDVGHTKSQSGLALSASNFRADVNASGAINATDVSQVKSSTGTAVP